MCIVNVYYWSYTRKKKKEYLFFLCLLLLWARVSMDCISHSEFLTNQCVMELFSTQPIYTRTFVCVSSLYYTFFCPFYLRRKRVNILYLTLEHREKSQFIGLLAFIWQRDICANSYALSKQTPPVLFVLQINVRLRQAVNFSHVWNAFIFLHLQSRLNGWAKFFDIFFFCEFSSKIIIISVERNTYIKKTKYMSWNERTTRH